MPHRIPWAVTTRDHPGSSKEDVQNEVDWSTGHQHRIGFKNREDRLPGITHHDDEHNDDGKSPNDAQSPNKDRQAVNEKRLVNFRDIAAAAAARRRDAVSSEERPKGWRDVFEYTEDWVKTTERWPANIKREQGAAQKRGEEEQKNKASVNGSTTSSGIKSGQEGEEAGWRQQDGAKDKHNDARAASESEQDEKGSEHGKENSEYEELLKQYSPQEIALLKCLRHEKEHRQRLKANDGKRSSPQTRNRSTIAIDVKDQFTPDNWLPRSSHMIRLTSNHPFNAEAELSLLYQAGLITPNELHYVRNHGAVPRLYWKSHTLDVENGKLVLSMDDLKDKFDSINIPVFIACDGNRRKEMNLTRKSKGFNWGAGAGGCAYWKGVPLRDVLAAVDVEADGQRWVNFEGADEPSEGKYATCIPLAYAMDPTNDVLLAYEMNDLPLPPDHGYPLRLVIPGYVGGRQVKWLAKVWISDVENTSHYHIWDNRVLPSFITEKDGQFAEAMFAHPSTACNEQNLNSVIVKPAQGERLPLSQAKRGQSYRIEGYAYDGGGHEVQRVEVSLDGGETWLYCIRRFPDYPIRHGKKFWTWLHWHVDVSIVHLLQARSIAVRAWNVFKNTQPEDLSWNLMGMMNNCWYVVKSEIESAKDSDPFVLFRHPCEPTGNGGWMKPSIENQVQNAKQQAGTPSKQFTREEIEKHDKEDDCWLVIDGNVYDATSVLSWHPGGKASLLGHAGKVHQETTDEFAAIHDDFAYKKLHECALGVVTQKAAKYIKEEAEAAAKANAEKSASNDKVALHSTEWSPVTLEARDDLSKDTRQYTFRLPNGLKTLGLKTCQHLKIGVHMKDKMLIRSYTPTEPLLPKPTPQTNGHVNGDVNGEGAQQPINDEVSDLIDDKGTFKVVVKTYFPTNDVPGGAMSNILDCVPIGEQVDILGPTGEIVYNGQGRFEIEGKERTFRKISLVLGGSGITPGYALIARVVAALDKTVQLRVVDANKSEKDILLRDKLKAYEQDSEGRLKIAHVLSHPSDSWEGLKGHIGPEIIKAHLFPPDQGSVVFLCGPPAMIQKAALPALKDWGYVEDENLFGF